EHQNDPNRDTLRYPDGRTFEQTRDKWEQDWRYWSEHSPGSPLALIYTARLLFKRPETVKKLDEMANTVDTYQRATGVPAKFLVFLVKDKGAPILVPVTK